MSFQTRAVDLCLKDFESGFMVETHIRDVLKSKNVDVSCFEQFLKTGNDEDVRLASARIISSCGNISAVISAALEETNREMLISLLSVVGSNSDGVEALCGLLESDDTIVRDAAVDMFRRTGKTDALFPLIFNTDDNVVKRIKRYINEARHD